MKKNNFAKTFKIISYSKDLKNTNNKNLNFKKLYISHY